MTSPERPAPDEIEWSTIEDACDKVELYRLESLTDEELDQDLRASGIDPKEGEQILQEVLSKLGNGAVPEPIASTPVREKGEAIARGVADGPAGPVRRSPIPGRDRAWWGARIEGPWLAAAGVAVVVGLGVAWLVHREEARPTSSEIAATKRAEAFGLCEAARWAGCRAKLDEAKRLDPAGDEDPRVQAARARIDQALRALEPNERRENRK